MGSQRIRPPVLVALLGLGACDSAPAPGPGSGTAARDSAGIRVVENRGPAWSDDAGWRLGAPTVDLGGADVDADASFSGVAVAAMAGTRLVVAEESGLVRFFDADGTHVLTVGGAGEGPGEFRLIAGGGVRGDTIWLYDYFLRRLTSYTPSGDLAGVRRLEGEDPSLLPVGRLDHRFLLARSNLAAGVDQLGLRRDTVPYLAFDADGGGRRVIAELPGREYVVGLEDGRPTMATPPFARAARHAARDAEWVQGDQERRELRVLTPDGAVQTVIRWPGPDLVITERALAAEIEDRVGQHGVAQRPGLRRFLQDLPRPLTRPAHGDVSIGPHEYIWVETAPGPLSPEPAGWQVFDPDGRWLGIVPAPGRFRITEILEDSVVGVWLDGLDVEHVQIRPILRPEPQPTTR